MAKTKNTVGNDGRAKVTSASSKTSSSNQKSGSSKKKNYSENAKQSNKTVNYSTKQPKRRYDALGTDTRTNKSKGTNRKKTKPIKIIPLGGLDEIGKNITLYEYDGDMFLVDCGMTFPDEETPGIDVVIPDFTYVINNKDKIKGLVVTHGHEDHIGAIPYLLKHFNLPIYGTRLTLGLIEGKLKEHKLMSTANLNVVKAGDVINLGKFSIEFIHVNHSIPGAVAVAVTTPAGTVIQTGDFKIDTTPIDSNIIDLGRFAELGNKGVLALLSDSTNAD